MLRFLRRPFSLDYNERFRLKLIGKRPSKESKKLTESQRQRALEIFNVRMQESKSLLRQASQNGIYSENFTMIDSSFETNQDRQYEL